MTTITAPGAGQAAAVWISILPDVSNFGAALTRDVAGVGGNAGDRIGREMGEATESGFSKAAKGIAAVGAGIGVALGAGLLKSMNVEAANDKLAAQLGLSGQEAGRYGEVAGRLFSSGFAGDMGAINEALRSVTQDIGGTAVASEKALEQIAGSALTVSSVFDQDLGGTTKAVGQLMRTGLAANATEAFDLITFGLQNSADRGGDFLDSLNESSLNLKQFGFTGQSALGIITQAMEAGAPSVGAVTGALEELIGNAGDSADVFTELGFNGAQMARDLSAGGPAANAALDQLLDRLRGMQDPAARSTALVGLFGEEATAMQGALLAIDPSEAMAKVAGFAGSTAGLSSATDNAASRIATFGQNLLNLGTTVLGDYLLPILDSVVNFVTTNFGPALAALGGVVTNNVIPAVSAMAGFIDRNRTPILIVAGIITAVFLPGLIALAVQSTITGVTTAAAWVTTQAAAIGAAAVHSVQVVKMVAGWVLLGAQSVVGAARVAASWLVSSAGAIAAGVVMAAQVAAQVALWLFLGVQSLISAAKVAAAWLVAIGPIGLVIAAVVGLVALIIANWDTVKAVTEKVFSFIGNFLTTVWNTIVNIFNTSVAFIRNLWDTFWNTLQSVASNVWNAIFNFIATVWAAIQAGFNAATTFLRDLWDNFWATLRQVAETVFTAIRVAVDFVWNLIKAGFQAAVDFVMFLWDNFWTGLRVIADFVFNAIRTAIEFVWNLIKIGFTTAVSFVQGIWQGFWDTLSRVASTVFNVIKGTIDTVIGGIIGAFDFVVRKVGEIWGGIKRLLAVPINFMINTVYNNGIVRAWNFVAGLLGIGGISTIPGIPEFARGGPVMNDTILRAGEAGPEYILSAPAVKNMGGVAAVERLHQRALFKDLQAGRLVEGADHEGPGFSTSGFGGVRPHVAKAGHFLKQKFGVGTVGGVGGRPGPSDHPSGHALDFMTYRDTAKGDALASYAVANARHFLIKYVIWKQRINEGAGWKGMPDRGSPTANHFDHPHVSFLPQGVPGRNFNGGGAGGGFLSFLLDQVRSLYDGATSGIPGAIASLVGNPPPEFRRIPPAMAATAIKSVGDFLFGKAAAADAASGGTVAGGGAGVERWRGVVDQALGLVGQSTSNAGITLRRMNQESSGNPNAVNRNDINWRRGTPSVGLMQVIGPTFRAHAGRYVGTPPQEYGVSKDPLANIYASMRYALSRYGSLASAYNRPGGYDSGGWMQPGFGTYYNGTNKPEAVLTNEQWSTLSTAVQGSDSPGVVVNMEVHNPLPESASDTAVRKLRTASAMGMFG